MEIITTSSFRLACNVYGDTHARKVALLLPGRLDTKEYACFIAHGEYLATKGFFVIALDPPGTWDSPGGIELFTTTNYVRAVHELIAYFGNKRTLLIGHSRGGSVAALVSVTNLHVAGIALINANYGVPTPPDPETIHGDYQLILRDLPPGDVKTTEQRAFKMPLDYFKDGQQYDIVNALQQFRKPKLLIYGLNDAFTSPNEVKSLYQTLHAPKMLYEIDAPHDYRYIQSVIKEVNTVIGEFIERYKI